jgi:hypothetical protein
MKIQPRMCNKNKIAITKLTIFNVVAVLTFLNYKTMNINSSYAVNEKTKIAIFQTNLDFI